MRAFFKEANPFLSYSKFGACAKVNRGACFKRQVWKKKLCLLEDIWNRREWTIGATRGSKVRAFCVDSHVSNVLVVARIEEMGTVLGICNKTMINLSTDEM